MKESEELIINDSSSNYIDTITIKKSNKMKINKYEINK